MAESIQHKLDRVRPPRVQITYDVEIGGAIQKKELPLVVGILADLNGVTENPLSLKERKFIEIDRDNFNDVLKSTNCKLKYTVPNRTGDGSGDTLPLELAFQTLDDFTPANLVHQIEGLRKLLDTRRRLNDLLAKLDGNDALNAELLKVVNAPDDLKQLQASNTPEETANA